MLPQIAAHVGGKALPLSHVLDHARRLDLPAVAGPGPGAVVERAGDIGLPVGLVRRQRGFPQRAVPAHEVLGAGIDAAVAENAVEKVQIAAHGPAEGHAKAEHAGPQRTFLRGQIERGCRHAGVATARPSTSASSLTSSTGVAFPIDTLAGRRRPRGCSAFRVSSADRGGPNHGQAFERAAAPAIERRLVDRNERADRSRGRLCNFVVVPRSDVAPHATAGPRLVANVRRQPREPVAAPVKSAASAATTATTTASTAATAASATATATATTASATATATATLGRRGRHSRSHEGTGHRHRAERIECDQRCSSQDTRHGFADRAALCASCHLVASCKSFIAPKPLRRRSDTGG